MGKLIHPFYKGLSQKKFCGRSTISLIFYLRVLFIGLFSCAVQAEVFKIGGMTLVADSMEWDEASNSVSLNGNVQIVFDSNHLKADQAKIAQKSKIINASGRVSLSSTKIYSEADEIQMSYETQKGYFVNGFVQSGQVIFEGSYIEKTGENEYKATNGKFTACTTCPEAWSFSGSEIEAKIGGYADIKYPVLHIGGVPVFILPRLLVPLKSQRQSGLLTPELESGSKEGQTIGLKWFWAISRSQDMTLTSKWNEKRGIKPLVEYRYLLSSDSSGTLNFGYLQDSIFKKKHPRGEKRAFFSYQHYWELPEKMIQRSNINWATDLKYPLDFRTELAGAGDPALENRISISKNTENQHFSVEALYNVNMLKSDPLAGNADSIHRLPEVRYSLADFNIYNTGLYANLDINYVQFVRNDFAYDDVLYFYSDADYQSYLASLAAGSYSYPYCYKPRADRYKCISKVRGGEFTPIDTSGTRGLDILRAGHRIQIKPTLSYPIQISKAIELVPTAKFEETQYRFQPQLSSSEQNYSDSAARRYVELSLTSKTRFSRIFAFGSQENSTLLKHEIEPVISFISIPWVRRPNHIFFGSSDVQPFSRSQEPISDSDFVGDPEFKKAPGIQFDYYDRLSNKRLIDFTLINRLIRKKWMSHNPFYEKIASLKITQYYDFDEANQRNPQPWSALESLLDVRLDKFDTSSKVTYFPYAAVANLSSRLGVRIGPQYSAELNYSRTHTRNETNDFRLETDEYSPGLTFSTRYLDMKGQFNYSVLTHRVGSWTYEAQIKPPGNCWNIRIRHYQELGQPEVRYKITADFNYGGENLL